MGASVRVPPEEAKSRPVALILVAYSLLASLGISLLLYPGWSEHRKVRSYRRVLATILASPAGADSAVRYTYTVGGRAYTGHSRFPLPWIGTPRNDGDTVVHLYRARPEGGFTVQMTSWSAVSRGYSPGQSVEAFYDPQNPGDTFLVPACFVYPFVWIPVLFVAFVVMLAAPSFVSHFRPDISWERWRQRDALLGLAVVWHIVGLLAYLDCFPRDEFPAPGAGLIGGVLGAYEGIGLLILGFAITRGRVRMALGTTVSALGCGAYLGTFAGLMLGTAASSLAPRLGFPGDFAGWPWPVVGAATGAVVTALLMVIVSLLRPGSFWVGSSGEASLADRCMQQ
jgi:uncharacterized protein DUF3592